MLAKGPRSQKISKKTIAAFFIAFALCTAVLSISMIHRMHVERRAMEQLVNEKSIKISETLSRILYKTQTLSALLLSDQSLSKNFDKIAAMLIDDPAILNVLIAPGGIVTHAYPLKGNEAALGLNFLREGAGNREAVLAMETRKPVLSGPFVSPQGVGILVGKLPVYIANAATGKETFWGFVSVSLKSRQALEGAGLNELYFQGLAYEIWRAHPDSGKKQVIASSLYKYNKNIHYVEKDMAIQNAEWLLKILPVRTWYEYPDTWLFAFLGLGISLLVAAVVQSNGNLQILQSNFENALYTDQLTSIYNRRYFMESAVSIVERAIRSSSDIFIIVFDIDRFKKINDEHGRFIGDDVAKRIVLRVKEAIRSYDLFARLDCKAFVVLADISESFIKNFAERLMTSISKEPFNYGNIQLSITASFGVAKIPSADTFLKSIECAYKALYAAKEEGRNTIVFYKQDTPNSSSI